MTDDYSKMTIEQLFDEYGSNDINNLGKKLENYIMQHEYN